MPEVVSQNDSVGCNPYENFKFVTEVSCHYGKPVEREVTYVSAAWNFVVLFVVLIFMVLNKFMSQQRVLSLVAMPFQNSGNERSMRDNPSFFNLASFLVIVSFVLMLSLFVQKIFIVYGGNRILHDNFDFFVDVTMCVSAILVFNYLLTSFHVTSMATCNLFLVPIILLLFFHPYKLFLILTLIILGVFFVITLVKLLIEVRMLSKLNFVNIFLYLCTVEILPIFVILKMIVDVL